MVSLVIRLMGKSFSNFKQLEQYIMEQVNSSLKQEMAEMTKGKISEHVKSDVYNAYPNPTRYKRRGFIEGSLGLGDVTRMDSKLIQDGVLEVVDNADFNHPFAYTHEGDGDINTSKSLAFNIEYGYSDRSEPWNEPRPFIEKTKEEIQSKGLHTQIMKSALKARGIDVV